MAEYIEREALLKDIEESVVFSCRTAQSAEMRGANKIIDRIRCAPSADVVERKHGGWELEAHKEISNYGWNVTAECPECRAEKKLVWRGLFPNFCDALAKELALDNAKYVKLSNFCPNCGAKMDGGADA